MVTALYPGSFDPVTNGHVDITKRGASFFDELVVGVYDTPSKSLLFNTSERVRLFAEAVAHIPNARVVPYTGLTVNFAREIGAKFLVRGLRSGTDFDYEFDMALMNRKVTPEVDTIFLPTALEFQFLSSTLLKEVSRYRGEVGDLVPAHVVEALNKKLHST